MARIKLGNRPKNFKRVIKFPMLDGTTGQIEVTYKYRTRKEFGEFIDNLITDSGSKAKEDGEKFSMAELMDRTAGSNADYIMDVVDAWDVDAEFTHENVQQLSDEIPAAVSAIMETYRSAITEGRLGN